MAGTTRDIRGAVWHKKTPLLWVEKVRVIISIDNIGISHGVRGFITQEKDGIWDIHDRWFVHKGDSITEIIGILSNKVHVTNHPWDQGYAFDFIAQRTLDLEHTLITNSPNYQKIYDGKVLFTPTYKMDFRKRSPNTVGYKKGFGCWLYMPYDESWVGVLYRIHSWMHTNWRLIAYSNKCSFINFDSANSSFGSIRLAR